MKFYMTLLPHILHHSLKLQRHQTKNVEMTASGKLHVRQSNIVDPGVLNVYELPFCMAYYCDKVVSDVNHHMYVLLRIYQL